MARLYVEDSRKVRLYRRFLSQDRKVHASDILYVYMCHAVK